MAGLTSIDLLSTRWVSGAVLGALGWFTPDYKHPQGQGRHRRFDTVPQPFPKQKRR